MDCARTIVLLLACVLASARCASAPPSADAASYDADGVFVRHLRLRLAPSHTKRFEALMERCVAAARAAPDVAGWLCYREPPGRYWLLQFAGTEDGFAAPATLAGFVSHVGGSAGPAEEAALLAALDALEVETGWEVVLQQKASWSTVEGMSTETHALTRIMERTVRPGREAAFDAALAARTAFLAEHGYPLPIEGFVVRDGAPGRAMQVVFPTDWSRFFAADSFPAFVRGLDEAAQEEYAARKDALMPTMSGAEYRDAAFAPELSHTPGDGRRTG